MRNLIATARESAALQWPQLTVGLAWRLAPAMVLVLAAGLALGNAQAGAIAAGGALIVGFGAFQQFAGSRAAPMLMALLGTGASTFIGTIAGTSTPAIALVALVYGFWCGILPALGLGAFWVGQQCSIFLVIAAAYAGGTETALARTVLVMAGGAAQLLSFGLIVALEGKRAPDTFVHQMAAGGASLVTGLGAHLRWGSPELRFAPIFAAAFAVAVLFERWLHLANGYWVAVTAVILLRPDFHDTLLRSLGRLIGTIGGAVLATIITHFGTPSPLTLAVLVVLFAFLANATLRLNYGVFAAFITGYIVFLLVLAGLAEPQVAEARILATALGGAIALAAHLSFLVWRRQA
jgi:hypothetical protein